MLILLVLMVEYLCAEMDLYFILFVIAQWKQNLGEIGHNTNQMLLILKEELCHSMLVLHVFFFMYSWEFLEIESGFLFIPTLKMRPFE